MAESGGMEGGQGWQGIQAEEGARLVVPKRLGPLDGRVVHERLERDLVRVEDQPVTICGRGCNRM